jgi:hypothetical protein
MQEVFWKIERYRNMFYWTFADMERPAPGFVRATAVGDLNKANHRLQS